VFAGDLKGLPNIVLDGTSEEIGFFNELPSRFKVQTFANDFAIEDWV
jgi:hypothetical protein